MINAERRFSTAVIVLLVLAGVSAVALAYRQIAAEMRSATHTPELVILGQSPHFTLTRENGQVVPSEMLAKKVWVADFIFTRCAGPCPRMTRRMADLQKKLAGIHDLRLVTFTVDPEYDTPKVLHRYAEQFGADPNRWWFLTGDTRNIRDIAIKGFKLAVGEDANDEHRILHSTRFVLVDQKGRIRGYYDEIQPGQMGLLAADIKQLTDQVDH